MMVMRYNAKILLIIFFQAVIGTFTLYTITHLLHWLTGGLQRRKSIIARLISQSVSAQLSWGITVLFN